MGTDLFIKAHAVYSYAKVSALTRIASALLLSITISLVGLMCTSDNEKTGEI